MRRGEMTAVVRFASYWMAVYRTMASPLRQDGLIRAWRLVSKAVCDLALGHIVEGRWRSRAMGCCLASTCRKSTGEPWHCDKGRPCAVGHGEGKAPPRFNTEAGNDSAGSQRPKTLNAPTRETQTWRKLNRVNVAESDSWAGNA
jgi:hypothetical protein